MENNFKFYNTLTRQIDTVVPRVDGKIGMYTCGPTVYHFAHIGNIRSYIMEDVLEKALRYVGYDVKRVMNITDVGHLSSDGDTGEDKMLKGAKREHKSVMEVAKEYTDAFFKDFPFYDRFNSEFHIVCGLRKAQHPPPGCGGARYPLHSGVYPYGGGAYREGLCLFCRRQCIFRYIKA